MKPIEPEASIDIALRFQGEGDTILRVARELRSFLIDAPGDDIDVRSLLRDCETLERVGAWLSTCQPLAAFAGHAAADGIPLRPRS
jgi:hypothetical protein